MVTTPRPIAEHPDSWFWVPCWQRMHARKQQFNAVFIGQCGTGKSYAALKTAHLLDRDERNNERFDIDRVAFSALDFTRISKKKWPVGTSILIDDAAFTAYSKDAMTREVKQVSKIFISQRHKRRCILLSIPSLTMLASNVRQTLLCLIHMMRIDETEKVSYARLLRIQLNPRDGLLWYKRFWYGQRAIHPKHGTKLIKNIWRRDLTFPMPPKDICNEYERRRDEAMRIHYEEADKLLDNKTVKRRTLKDDYEMVKEKMSEYLDLKGNVDMGKIILSNNLTEYRARMIARILNDEIKGGNSIKSSFIE